jgi:hypothetical protein
MKKSTKWFKVEIWTDNPDEVVKKVCGQKVLIDEIVVTKLEQYIKFDNVVSTPIKHLSWGRWDSYNGESTPSKN